MQKNVSRNGASGSGLHQRPDISTAYEPPRSDVEKLLVEIWKSALRFEDIGVNDNFFELGGHSLLALQLLKNMNETFSSRLALKDLFDTPTIAQLARKISGADADTDEDLEALLADIEGMPEEKLRAELQAAPGETEA
jgi:acyl carrier protein